MKQHGLYLQHVRHPNVRALPDCRNRQDCFPRSDFTPLQIYLRLDSAVSSSHLHSFKHGNNNGASGTRNQGPTNCCGSSMRYCDPSDRGHSKVLVQGTVNRNSFLVGRLDGARGVGKALYCLVADEV